jgi:hypothetical protein
MHIIESHVKTPCAYLHFGVSQRAEEQKQEDLDKCVGQQHQQEVDGLPVSALNLHKFLSHS